MDIEYCGLLIQLYFVFSYHFVIAYEFCLYFQIIFYFKYLHIHVEEV